MAILDSRMVRFWVLVTLTSLFAWNLYWLIDSFVGQGYSDGFGMVVNAFNALFSLQVPTLWVAGHTSSVIGLMIRFFELTLALALVYLLWGRGKTFLSLKNKVSIAISLEGIYFLSFLLPAFMIFSLSAVFTVSYLLQILLISPLTFLVATVVKRNSHRYSLTKVLGLAYLSYVATIWINNISRWITMAQSSGIEFLLSGKTAIGFANAAVFLSLALLLAGAVFLSLLKRRSISVTAKLLGVSLAALGAHFLIYLVYSFFTGSLGSVMLVEIWAVPLLGSGASLFHEASRTSKASEPLSSKDRKVTAEA